ncbi:MAG: Uma2 family endonuclease [Prevotellaceae bacterium]|jgi:Uma2 family endonuclease|nr:Uma2 family endonuclease [Prevotellaceae bacterium]
MKEYTFPTEEKEVVKRRYTYADVIRWDDEVRRELINGFVYTLPTPWTKHAVIKTNLGVQIHQFIERRKIKCKIFFAPFDIRLSPTGETADDKIDNVVEPDVCVIFDPSKLDERGCLGAPDLIVEILLSCNNTAKRILNEKFHLYEATGVREYWVIYPEKEMLKVFILQDNGKYDNGTVYVKKGKAPVHIFEGLSIDLKKLFAE